MKYTGCWRQNGLQRPGLGKPNGSAERQSVTFSRHSGHSVWRVG